MGKLLGDPEVWDDSVVRPRVALRGGAALLAGLALGGLVGFLVTGRPVPSPPAVVVPGTQPVPALPINQTTLANVSLASGRMLVSSAGQIFSVKPDGSGLQALASSATASAAVGPARDGSLVVLDNGTLERLGSGGAPKRLTAATFTVGGLAGNPTSERVLACGGPTPRGDTAQRPDSQGSSVLLPSGGGRATPVGLGCPVAWAAAADRIAGTGGPRLRFRARFRGSSVLAGRSGGPLVPVIGADVVRAVGGRRASVGAVALSSDGRWVAAAVGAAGGRWTVLVQPLAGGRASRLHLADGYEAAWLGWKPGGSGQVLAVAALDRRGDLADLPLADREGDGYVMAFDVHDRTARTMVAGAPMVRADGFAWSSDGQSLGISSSAGWTVVLDVGSSSLTPSPVTGTLVSWPGGGD